jgi:hypothetical protein
MPHSPANRGLQVVVKQQTFLGGGIGGDLAVVQGDDAGGEAIGQAEVVVDADDREGPLDSNK